MQPDTLYSWYFLAGSLAGAALLYVAALQRIKPLTWIRTAVASLVFLFAYLGFLACCVIFVYVTSGPHC